MLEQYLQPYYLKSSTMTILQQTFQRGRPFPHLVLKDFFVKKMLVRIARTLRQEEFVRQESDLFSFAQTADLSQIKNDMLQEFYRFLNSREFRDYVHRLTAIAAFGTLDCSGFMYGAADFLLPHDDELGTRKLAYTIHLSDDFARGDGGALEFFDKGKIAVSLPPHFNTMILFPVLVGKTVHQVSEVVVDKERLSLSGWFHA